jgi:hypothetical protein
LLENTKLHASTQNKASLDLVGKQIFTFNGEPHKNLRENKAQVAQKIVGRQIFMSRNTKHENLALPPHFLLKIPASKLCC